MASACKQAKNAAWVNMPTLHAHPRVCSGTLMSRVCCLRTEQSLGQSIFFLCIIVSLVLFQLNFKTQASTNLWHLKRLQRPCSGSQPHGEDPLCPKPGITRTLPKSAHYQRELPHGVSMWVTCVHPPQRPPSAARQQVKGLFPCVL